MKFLTSLFQTRSPRAVLPAALTFVLGVAMSLGLNHKIAEAEDHLTLQKLDLESHHINDKLVLLLGARMKALQRFANIWAMHDGMSEAEWLRITGNLMTDMTELRGIEWADQAGVIRRVAPAAARREFLGVDLSKDEARGSTLADARETQAMNATPLIGLRHGGTGFVVFVPVATNTKRSGGYVIGVYDLQALLAELDHAGYQLRVLDVGSRLAVKTATTEEIVPKYAQTVDFSSPLHEWKIEVVPVRSTVENQHSPFSRVALVYGLLVSVLAGVLVFLLGRWRRGNQNLRRALAELKLYRFALDQATMVTIRTDQGILTYVNDLFCETIGFSREEIIGNHQSMFDDPVAPAMLTPEDWARIRAGHVWQGDMRHRRKDGSILWVDKTIVPCVNERGQVYQYISIQRDITARKETVDEFRHMIENMPGGAILINESGFYANRAVETLTGYSREDLNSVEAWFNFVHGDRAAENMASYESDNRREYRGTRVVPILTAAGAIRTLNIYTYRDAKVEIWLLHDVTETLAAQERFRMLFEHSSDGQLIVDYAEGRCLILDVNPAVVKMLGYDDKGQIIGRSSNDFSAPYHLSTLNTPELFAERIGRANSEQNEFEWDRVRRDGTIFPVRSTTSPVEIGGRTVILSTWHDLTAEKEVQSKLVHSSKMQSLGEMSGGLSHELNTPLATIKAKVQHLGMLAQAGQLPPRALSDGLAKIEITADRMSRIVSGLRHFAQDTEGEPMTTENVTTLVHDALAFCRARLTLHGVTVTVNLAQDIEISCRPWQITQAILNLLNNSLDAVQNRDERWIKIFAHVVNDGLEISVVDGGPGIPPAVRERMMQPFFTTKPVGHGTGLGLSVSQGIIESHGGELAFDPASANTTFVIRLPMAQSVTWG